MKTMHVDAIGDYLIISSAVTGRQRLYIAQVAATSPIVVKIQEYGVWAKLTKKHFEIRRPYTNEFQKNIVWNKNTFLDGCHREKFEVITALRGFGFSDDKFHSVREITLTKQERARLAERKQGSLI